MCATSSSPSARVAFPSEKAIIINLCHYPPPMPCLKHCKGRLRVETYAAHDLSIFETERLLAVYFTVVPTAAPLQKGSLAKG